MVGRPTTSEVVRTGFALDVDPARQRLRLPRRPWINVPRPGQREQRSRDDRDSQSLVEASPDSSATSTCGRVAVSEVAEQRMGIRERRGQDLSRDSEQLRNTRVSDAVINVGSGAPAFQNALLAKRREVLRGATRIDLQLALKFAYRAFGFAEQLQYSDPYRMAQNLEQLGFDHVHRIRAHVRWRSVDHLVEGGGRWSSWWHAVSA